MITETVDDATSLTGLDVSALSGSQEIRVSQVSETYGPGTPDLAAWAFERANLDPSIRFLSRHERLEIAGVRHDQHGDLGPNGARGTAANIGRTGEKANIGHSHSAAICHGCYQAGLFATLDMGYNRGPSSWSHSAILTYGNGKRAVITLRAGEWCA